MTTAHPALGGDTIEQIVATAIENDDDLVVAYGVAGASSDGWTSFEPSVERLNSYLRHARSRCAGKAGYQLVYGPLQEVHAYYFGTERP